MNINDLTLGQAKELVKQLLPLIGQGFNDGCKDRETTEEKAVLVTTEHRGVFFGYAKDTSGDTIKLRAARNCIYWPAENKGFLGLASDGPIKGARVGPPADIELRAITCVALCTEKAVSAWESEPWSK
jgi:hypothetical protein